MKLNYSNVDFAILAILIAFNVIVAIVVVLPMFGGCSPAVDPRAPEPSAGCPDACAVLTALQCPEAEKTLKGTSCVDFCERYHKSAPYMPEWKVCVSNSLTVQDVRACGMECEP